jgi:hypothetical protein
MRRIRSAVVNGARWHVEWDRCDDDYGECDWEGKTITINPALDPVATVDTAIHEYLHARLPDLSEDSINQIGTELSEFLRRLEMIEEDRE